MNVTVRGFTLLLSLVLFTGIASGQTTVATSPVGYVQLTCTAASDTVVSVPLTQPPVFVGPITSVSGSTVTVSSTTGWTANQFVYSGSGSSTYYAQMGPASSGTDPKNGSYYTIASNGTNSLTLDLNGDNISSVPAGSTVTVIPYWTLATVFPPSASGTWFIATTSPFSRQTQILLPDYSGTGVFLAASPPYYFYNGGWVEVGSTASANDQILLPDGYFIVRNPNATTTLTAVGNVLTANFMIPLATEATESQDNSVAICRPVDTSLNNLGLISSGAFTATTSPFNRQDELLLFNNALAEENKPANPPYIYYIGSSGTGWRLTTDLTTDQGGVVLPAGTGAIIRKAPTGTGNTAFWQNAPTY